MKTTAMFLPLLLGVLLPQASRAMARDLPTRETTIGRLSLDVLPDSLVISPDSSRLAFGTKAGILNLQDKGIFQNSSGVPIHTGDPAPDLPQNLRASVMLMIDDRGTPAFEMLTPAIFSPDSRHVAFGGKKEKKWHVVVDNRTVTQDADSLPANPIAFSPDSAHVAWVMEKNDRFVVTVDQQAWPPIDALAVGMLTFSPDSRHVAALARVKTNWTLFVDGHALPLPPPPISPAPAVRPGGIPAPGSAAGAAPRTSPRPPPPPPPPSTASVPPSLDRFSQFCWRPDSSGLGFYAAFRATRWQVFSQSLDGTYTYISPLCDAILKNSPIFSADGEHLVFASQSHSQWTIVTDTNAPNAASAATAPAGGAAAAPTAPPPVFDMLRGESLGFIELASATAAPAHAAAGALVYLAARNKKWQLYVDHQPSGEACDGIIEGSFVVSPDRHHFAFGAVRGGRAVIIRDGAVLATHESAGADTFSFSPDSQHLAYAAYEGGRWFACVDAKVGKSGFTSFALAPIAFSPDSARVAFSAIGADKSWRLIVGQDGEYQSKAYYSFLKGSRVTWRATPPPPLLGPASATRAATRPAERDDEGGDCIVAIAIEKKMAMRVEARPSP